MKAEGEATGKGEAIQPTPIDPIQQCFNAAAERLLAERNDRGHWRGELSSSALSTATAVFALHLKDGRDPSHRSLIDRGVAWLLAHQNRDGGWGDTTLSKSNISTTALVWACLTEARDAGEASRRAEAWLAQAAGGLTPEALASSIKARYGKDQTFSVPILTMCALAGKLGSGRDAWKPVAQLPFELAACPQRWFQWLRLPVVSYALPALIAIGQVRHHHRPSGNPLLRNIRNRTRAKTLRLLETIQPTGGGFLEATPLTSFVVMSLISSGQAAHPVVERGVGFLARSIRSDGSWPIDTDLATWLTTLSINALAESNDFERLLPEKDRTELLEWLLNQQYQVKHPYTGAAPGAWAWTDLPGGVPDADDTAGALLALRRLKVDDPRLGGAVQATVGWLLDLQNRDGGMPTFCRGWGTLPFDRSGADLTAHAIAAWVCWQSTLPPVLASRVERGLERAIRYLARQQRPDGSWLPLWFGNQDAADDINPTYGTARVLAALGAVSAKRFERLSSMRRRAVDWLLSAQNEDGSWGGDRRIAGSIEETALALVALRSMRVERELEALERARAAGLAWLSDATRNGAEFPPAPIGFYFARLWYFERLYPLIFATAALGG